MITHPALGLAREIADRLAYPATSVGAVAASDWRRQSLGHGVPGIALLHIELAAHAASGRGTAPTPGSPPRPGSR